MPQKKNSKKDKVPEKFSFGRTNLPNKTGISNLVSKKGRIDTKYPEVKWTPTKLSLTIAGLCVPFFAGLITAFVLGNTLVGFIFVGLGALVGGMYLLLRYIEKLDS